MNTTRAPRECPIQPNRSRIAAWGALVLCLNACKPYDLPPSDTSFQPCCGSIGTCVPGGLIPKEIRSQLGRDVCEPQLLCVPRDFAENAAFVPATCHAGAAEGRCLPTCIPQIQEQATQFQRDGCGQDELCVYCYDPRTGKDTGSCHLGADPGPREPAYTFGKCCGGDGLCVPVNVIESATPTSDITQLHQRDCAEPKTVCVAASWLDAGELKLSSCRSLAGVEGRCVPECIIDTNLQSGLMRDSCQQNEVCAPCYDPRTGADTSVCRQGSDQPKEPPHTFPGCCSNGGSTEPLGSCVPREIAQSAAQDADLDQLSRDSCTNRNELCVPSEWLSDTEYVPPECRAAGNMEGRCLPTCLPSVATEQSRLIRSTCKAGSICVPCYHPINGDDTGACRQNQDAPREPPNTIVPCCGTGNLAAGTCINRELLMSSGVSDADVEQLGRDTCKTTNTLCVPNAWLADQRPTLMTCHALGSFEGRCLPACLPQVAEQASRLERDVCAQSDLCVPCYDPITGEDTGACRVNDDRPTAAPEKFEACCGSGDRALGRCIPKSTIGTSVDQAQLDALGPDTCAAADSLCVPSAWLDSDAAPPASCMAPGKLEGRCLPKCLPLLAGAQGMLTPSTCAEQELCAPCFNPQTGAATGACNINGDRPAQPMSTFDTCCGNGTAAQGTCVPTDFLEAGQRQLPVDTCRGYDARCVPTPLFKDPTLKLKRCTTSTLEQPGLCLGQCFVGSLGNTFLGQSSCDEGERCVPCSSVPTPELGCE